MKRQQMADFASSSRRAATTLRRSRLAALTETQLAVTTVTRSARSHRAEPLEPVVASVRAETPTQSRTRPTEVAAEPVDPQAHMMSFVEQLRGKTSNDPISPRLRQP
jgi:hypothetical protein